MAVKLTSPLGIEVEASDDVAAALMNAGYAKVAPGGKPRAATAEKPAAKASRGAAQKRTARQG